MIDLERYQRLKSEAERLRTERDRAEGALAQLASRLEGEFGCGSRKEAEVRLGKLREKRERLEAEFAERLGQFEGDWGSKLEGEKS